MTMGSNMRNVPVEQNGPAARSMPGAARRISTLGGCFDAELPAGPAAVVPTPRVTVFEGGIGAGKTAALVAHVVDLLMGDGVTDSEAQPADVAQLDDEAQPAEVAQPADVLVLCATPAAADAFAAMLADALEAPGAEGGAGAEVAAGVEGAAGRGLAARVRVTTPRRFALDVLADPQVQAATGRRPRVLAPFEADVLMGELSPLGVAPDRQEQIVRFFERSWSDLAHRDPAWLVTHEERDLIALLEAGQGATGGLLPVQVVPLIADYLALHPSALETFGAAHVVVDDLLLQPRAVQALASLLARESLAVSCDVRDGGPSGAAGDGRDGALVGALACTTAVEPYPCATGLDELLAVNPAASRVDLGPGRGEPTTVEAAGIAVPAVRVPLEERAFDDAFEEFEGVARIVREHLDAGMAPHDVCVVAAHPTWRANLAIALEDAGIAVACGGVRAAGGTQATGGIQVVDGAPMAADAMAADAAEYAAHDEGALAGVLAADPRDDGSCAMLRAFTLLQLAADPRDPVALRSWCGLGDRFVRAAEFAAVYEFMDQSGLGLADALAELARFRRSGGLGGEACGQGGACDRADACGQGEACDQVLRRAPQVVRAYELACDLVEKALVGACGEELLRRVAQLVVMPEVGGVAGAEGTTSGACAGDDAGVVDALYEALAGLAGPVGSQDDARVLAARALRRAVGSDALPDVRLHALTGAFAASTAIVAAGVPGAPAEGVRLCGLRDAFGLAPRLLVVAGCMDGFIPSPAAFQDTTVPGAVRERLVAAETYLLQSMIANADRTVATYTRAMPSANADLLGLETTRLRLRNGERAAILGRSVCLG